MLIVTSPPPRRERWPSMTASSQSEHLVAATAGAGPRQSDSGGRSSIALALESLPIASIGLVSYYSQDTGRLGKGQVEDEIATLPWNKSYSEEGPGIGLKGRSSSHGQEFVRPRKSGQGGRVFSGSRLRLSSPCSGMSAARDEIEVEVD